MSEHIIDEMRTLDRVANDFLEPPIVMGRQMSKEHHKELMEFVIDTTDAFCSNIAEKRAVTSDDFRKVSMACTKWALERFTSPQYMRER